MSRRLSDVARSVPRIEGSEVDVRSSFVAGASKGGEMSESSSAPERRTRQGMDYGETEDVHQVHAAIQREKREPRVGLEPLSLWLIAIYGLAIFFGGAYLGRFSGNFSGDGLDPLSGPPPAKNKGPNPP